MNFWNLSVVPIVLASCWFCYSIGWQNGYRKGAEKVEMPTFGDVASTSKNYNTTVGDEDILKHFIEEADRTGRYPTSGIDSKGRRIPNWVRGFNK